MYIKACAICWRLGSESCLCCLSSSKLDSTLPGQCTDPHASSGSCRSIESNVLSPMSAHNRRRAVLQLVPCLCRYFCVTYPANAYTTSNSSVIKSFSFSKKMNPLLCLYRPLQRSMEQPTAPPMKKKMMRTTSVWRLQLIGKPSGPQTPSTMTTSLRLRSLP